MSERMDSLLKLQRLDAEMEELRKRQSAIPRKVRDAEKAVQGEEEKLAQTRQALKKRKEQGRLKELDLASREEKAEKLKSQLLQIKGNKEYQALRREIEHELEEASRFESEAIEALETIDALNADCASMVERIEASRKELEEKRKESAERLDEVEREIEEKSQLRRELASTVEGGDLAEYSRLAKRYGGGSVVAVMEQTCTGCRLQLPPQIVSELLMERKLVFCPGCARILYLGEAITADEV